MWRAQVLSVLGRKYLTKLSEKCLPGEVGRPACKGFVAVGLTARRLERVRKLPKERFQCTKAALEDPESLAVLR